jgi:hypothetical protein
MLVKLTPVLHEMSAQKSANLMDFQKLELFLCGAKNECFSHDVEKKLSTKKCFAKYKATSEEN